MTARRLSIGSLTGGLVAPGRKPLLLDARYGDAQGMTSHPMPTLFLVPRQRVGELPWEPLAGMDGVEHRVLFRDDKTVAGLLRLHGGAGELTHVHLQGEHHVWVLDGDVTLDDTNLPADSYVHVPSRLPHRIADTGGGSLLFYVFCVSAD